MKLTKSTLKQIIKEELGKLPHGLDHIEIIDATDPLYKDDWGSYGHLQGVWTTSLDNLMAMEEENWWPDPDHVDQLDGSQVPDGVGPPRWRQYGEYEDEKTNVYWREFYGDEQEPGVKNSREGFIKRMKEYDSNIEQKLQKLKDDSDTVAESRIKLTKSQLKQIIEEEIKAVLYEETDSHIKKIVDWHEANKKRLSIDDAVELASDVGEGEAWGGPEDAQQAKEQEDLENRIVKLAGPLNKENEPPFKSWDELLAAYHKMRRAGRETQAALDSYDVGGSEFDLRENKIKVTKTQLEQIIREELSGILKENRHYQRYGSGSGYGPKVSMQAREVELALQDAGIVGVSLGDVKDIINAYKRSGKSALDQLEHLKDQLASRDYRFRAHKPMGDEVARDIDRLFEEKTYPNNSTMKKLVRQAKLDSRYEPNSDAQLKKDYDKHVRGTLRDPKHSQAHKK